VIAAFREVYRKADLSQPDNEATESIDWDYCNRCRDVTLHGFQIIDRYVDKVRIAASWKRPNPKRPGELVPCTPFDKLIKVTVTLRWCLACRRERGA
jgi:hypothetical protein